MENTSYPCTQGLKITILCQRPKPKPLLVPAPTGDKAISGPSLANLAEIEEWDQGNLEAHIQIFMTLDYETASLVNGKDLVAKVWVTLNSCFKGKGLSAMAMLASKLWQYNIQTENDISMQIQDMKISLSS